MSRTAVPAPGYSADGHYLNLRCLVCGRDFEDEAELMKADQQAYAAYASHWERQHGRPPMALGYCTFPNCNERALRDTTACRAHAEREELIRSLDEAEGMLAELVRGATLRSPCLWCAHPDDPAPGFQHTSTCLVWRAERDAPR